MLAPNSSNITELQIALLQPDPLLLTLNSPWNISIAFRHYLVGVSTELNWAVSEGKPQYHHP